MKRYLYALFVLMGLILLTCSRDVKDSVVWKPAEPAQGDIIKVTYNSNAANARLVNSEDIYLIYQLFRDDSDTTIIKQMKRSGDRWRLDIKDTEDICLISIKFEDNLARADDNAGRGWSIGLSDVGGSPIRNSHYYRGQILLGDIRPEAYPYYKKAIEEFEKELDNFPDNFDAWFGKWKAEKEIRGFENQAIREELDSLLALHPENCDLMMTGFWTNLKVFSDKENARRLYDTIEATCAGHSELDEMEYALIFDFYDRDRSRLKENLLRFIERNKTSELLESAYFRLGNIYLQEKNEGEAEKIFSMLSELDTENMTNWLSLASIKIRRGNFREARALLNQAMSRLEHTEGAISKWVHPGKRATQKNLDICQLYSTRASLNFASGRYAESIADRKTVLTKGTPFPAFELIKIGDAFKQSGKTDSAKIYYAKAFIQSPEQEEALDRLYNLYKSEQALAGETVGFKGFLNRIIEKESRKQTRKAPEFEATLLDGGNLSSHELRGKIIVLTFWDPWCQSCTREIAQLNELAEELGDMEGIEFVAVSSENKTSIDNFLEGTKFGFKHVYNGNQIKKDFDIFGYPAHVIIDQNYILNYLYIGYDLHIKQKLKRSILSIIN